MVTFFRGIHQESHQDTHQDTIINFCTVPRSKKEIAVHLGLTDLRNLSIKYINPVIDSGLIKMTIPDKPNSKNQKYVSVK